MSDYFENLARARARWPSPRALDGSDDPLADPLPKGRVDAAWLAAHATDAQLFALRDAAAVTEDEFRAALLEYVKRQETHTVLRIATACGLPGDFARELIEAHAVADRADVATNRKRSQR